MCSKSTCMIGTVLFITLLFTLMVDTENLLDCIIKSKTFRKLKSYNFKTLLKRIWEVLLKLRKRLLEKLYYFLPQLTCTKEGIAISHPKWLKPSEPKWKTFFRKLGHYLLALPRLICNLPIISCFCPCPPPPPMPLTEKAKEYVEKTVTIGKMIIVDDYDKRQKEKDLEDCQAELAKAMLRGSCTGGSLHRAKSRRAMMRDRSTRELICKVKFYVQVTGFVTALLVMLAIHLILMSPEDSLSTTPKEKTIEEPSEIDLTA